MIGILNIHKPPKMTSRDVVNHVQRLVRPAKAGHAGTLDPLASGVLVLCVGGATRLIGYIQQMPKRYEAAFLLGLSSKTDDLEEEPVPLPNAPQPTREQVLASLPAFVGEILQRPPSHSAVKVRGKRAFALARQGKEVDLAARPVVIQDIKLIAYEYPRLKLDVRCGSGTYIRSLGRDLAERLGTVAVMAELIRTEVGDFRLAETCSLNEIVDSSKVQGHLRSPREALSALPVVTLGDAEVTRIRAGQFIPAPPDLASREAQAVDAAGNLVAILERHRSGLFKPAINIGSQS